MEQQDPLSLTGDPLAQTGLEPAQGPDEPATDVPVVTRGEIRGLLEFSPDALVIVDRQGTLVQVNAQAALLFGYDPQELPGQRLELLLPERFRREHGAHRAGFVLSPRTRPMGVGLDLLGRRKDASEFPVDISLRPIMLEEALHVVGAIHDLSLRRLLEREREQQSERISLQTILINLARDAILMRDPINRILFWNRGAEELYGWTEQEVLGRVTHTLLKTRFPLDQAIVDAQLEHEGQWEGELTHTRRDGRQIVVESRQIAVRNQQNLPTAILEINRDITERRQVEYTQTRVHSEVLAQRAFLQAVLDALPTSVAVVHGPQACLVLANRAATGLWGAVWTPGQPMSAFLETHQIRIVDSQGAPCAPHTWATMRALRQGETVLQHQEVIRQPSGASVPILVNAVPLVFPSWQRLELPAQSGDNDPPRPDEPLALVLHQDVRVLKEAEYFKDEFIGIAAHELRQPLSALKAAVGTLVFQTARGHGPPLADWQQEMLRDLEQATDQLSDLTEDLLDVSRLQAGQALLQRTSTNIVSLVERLVERLQTTTKRHHLELRTSQGVLEATIDPRRIEQVLINLLNNAIKYSPQGGPVMVALEASLDAQTVEIRVQDWGIGIPQHQQAQIFGRFVRADNAQAAGIRGTGLGLYLARALVEQHGGQLWFVSTEGAGTTFFVSIPLLPSSPGF